MARFVRLSYEIGFRHPGWPGNYTYEWEPVSSIERGDVANFGILHLLPLFLGGIFVLSVFCSHKKFI